MNKIIYLLFLICFFLSCQKDYKQKNEYLQKEKTDKIDSLANRYLELNRFSGTILIAKENEVIYNNHFGFADYEKKKHFSKNTTLKIKKDSTILDGKISTHSQNVDTTLAIGYLYDNYRGNGLELHRSPISKNKWIDLTASDLLKIINSNPEKIVEIDDYLKNDGFSYSIVYRPKTKISIIVLSNRRHPIAKEISTSITAILNNQTYKLPLARKLFDIDKKLLKEYSGYYALNENVNLKVLCENDSLFVMMGPNKIHLIAQSSNQFYMKQMDASMRFLKDSAHTVNEAILLDGFLEGKKIKRVENN